MARRSIERESVASGRTRPSRWWWLLRAPGYLLLATAIAAGYLAATPTGIRPATDPIVAASASVHAPARTVVPAVAQRLDGDDAFRIGSTSTISAIGEALPVARYLQTMLRDLTGFELPISRGGDIALVLGAGPPENGYQLEVRPAGIRLAANDTDALFWGVQTLRQLLPLSIDTKGAWAVASTLITDSPRFTYRGAMLDVARHFFGVDDVKRYIDDIAMLKLNVLHLHLSDDQGWRIAIDGWPRLTSHGGSTEVGGGPGGFYTQDDYRDIVAYARSRHVTIVPEIDMPGHTNAALSSYPELNCSGWAPRLYTGTRVGFSSLCVHKAVTYRFIEDVVSQLAALTPGPWIHIGGDESSATNAADYVTFVNRATAIVAEQGKTVIGWHDIGYGSALPPGTIGQYWDYTTPRGGSWSLTQWILDGGGKLVMAPSNVAYLDQKYDLGERLGTTWAQAPTTIQEAYGWDPADIFPSRDEAGILGVEAPLWTETLETMAQIEYMAFPRIVAIAEIGWSPREGRSFEEFAPRLGAFGPYLEAAGVTFNRTPGVPWPTAP